MSMVQEVAAKRQAHPRFAIGTQADEREWMEGEVRMARAMLREQRKREAQRPDQGPPFFAKPVEARDPAVLWWNVPRCGGAKASREVGEDLAVEFLKYLRRTPEGASSEAALGYVFNGMAASLIAGLGYSWDVESPNCVSPEVQSILSQVEGFCKIIGRWGQSAAKQFGGNLDSEKQEYIVSRVSRALSGEAA